MAKACFMTSWGMMSAAWDERGLTGLTLPQEKTAAVSPAVFLDKPRGFLADLEAEIEAYFQGKSRCFRLPFVLEGPPFYLKVWRILSDIPYGEIISYKELADLAGNDKAMRAAGAAMRQNPLPLFIPCHRVIAKDRSLGGFSGAKEGPPLELKKRLLLLEGHSFDDQGKLSI